MLEWSSLCWSFQYRKVLAVAKLLIWACSEVVCHPEVSELLSVQEGVRKLDAEGMFLDSNNILPSLLLYKHFTSVETFSHPGKLNPYYKVEVFLV